MNVMPATAQPIASKGANMTHQPDSLAAQDPAAQSAVAEIARRHLRLDTLETRNSDALDFHDLAVWSIRDALLAAYAAGAGAAADKQEG
jgi:hypothetical protein